MRSDDTIDFVIASAVQAFVYFERAFCDTYVAIMIIGVLIIYILVKLDCMGASIMPKSEV